MNLMNYKTALEILEIDMSEKKYSDINLEYLKKQYHKLALQNHPDKNGNTSDSKAKFQVINEAYDYLKREINFNEQCIIPYYKTLNIEIIGNNIKILYDYSYFDIFKNIIVSILKKN